MFPAMLVGPSVAGITLTAMVDGRAGLRDLLSRIRKARVGGRWYAVAILIPPSLILVVLVTLSSLVSPVFAPQILTYGIAFGVLAGLLEEIGWTGYAFPRWRQDMAPSSLPY
jgi:membrane protease YdiL (CAAX protease family)